MGGSSPIMQHTQTRTHTHQHILTNITDITTKNIHIIVYSGEPVLLKLTRTITIKIYFCYVGKCKTLTEIQNKI